MKKLLDKATSSLKHSPSPPSSSSPPPSLPLGPAQASTQCQTQSAIPQQQDLLPSTLSAAPTAQDVLRYRYHHGTNLGSIFVLERWLTPSLFAGPGDSELAAVTAHLRAHGLASTRARWEEHWATAGLSDRDLEWLVGPAKCTSVRLPVGYWTLGERFCAGTPFAAACAGGGGGGVYDGAWPAVKALVRRARSWGVGVLVDFHGLPGGANREGHSGSGSGKAEFWSTREYRDLALRCIQFMATELKDLEGVIGLQVVNEALWDARGMYEWYEEVLRVVGEVDESLPVYVSDGWDLGRALEWTGGRRGVRNPIVVDTHKYYTFSDKDRSQTPAEIINRIPKELSELVDKEGSVHDRGEAQVIVGEYSCVLDGQTWGRVRPEDKEDYVKQFGRAQSKKWQESAGGAYFWTLKMDWMEGGEWGFVEQVNKGNILPPPSLLIPREEAQRRASQAGERRGALADEARAEHEEYWNRTCPGQPFEHERYSHGWHVAFSDALSFFLMRASGALGDRAGEGCDRIGCIEIWVKKRLLESGQGGAFVWEWEQGFRAGVQAFNTVVGI